MSTTYEVVASRSGDWWAIEVVSGLPSDVLGVSQARRLGEVPDRARSVVADLLEVNPEDVEVRIEVELPAELQKAVDRYGQADSIESAARSAAASARSQTAATLVAAGLTMRETGELLGISHQRVKHLVDRARRTEATAAEADSEDQREMAEVAKLAPAAETSVDDVRQRMAAGAERLRRAGLGGRDVDARLAWKDERGIDTSVERRLVEAE